MAIEERRQGLEWGEVGGGAGGGGGGLGLPSGVIWWHHVIRGLLT